MKSIHEIHQDAFHVTLEAAKAEVKRENEIRNGTPSKPGAFRRWAKQEPGKATTYEKQLARTIAVGLVLSTMDDREWARRLHAASKPQASLF
ncbi:MAG: hypothetical protein KDD27_14615 [Saprospiraceae bacterium]|nr:hypothetical protein [Saprospiraceae bacterium]